VSAADSKRRERLHALGVYAAAVVIIAVAIASDFALTATILAVPFLLFSFAVLLVSWVGGAVPGIVTLLMCVVIGNVVLREPIGQFTGERDALVAGAFILFIGGIVIYLISSHQAALMRERREHERRLLLAEVGSTLDRSLDYETTLSTVAHRMVPQLADWCSVYMLEDGSLRRIAMAAVVPEKISLTRELAERHPLDMQATRGVGAVLRTGEPELVSNVERATLETEFPDEDVRAKLLGLGICSYMVVPIRRESGEVMGAIALAMAESRRRYDSDDLDVALALASRAALAIEHAQLYCEARTERERAEKASRAKDQFLAMLGHELRNPLAPIRTALELMETRDSAAFSKERRVITRQLDQLISLVDDLLDVSRIARGKVELHREPLTVHEVVTKGIELASPLIEARRHQLRVEVDPELLVDGDPARLAQVVSNLVVNAAKYTEPDGHIVVTGSVSGTRRGSPSATTASGSPRTCCPTCSTCSCRHRSRSIDRAVGSGSGSRS
jgi:K+-sensing histidine kinase KdpD